MLHLRADFFEAFAIPEITDDVKAKYIDSLERAFDQKRDAYTKIAKIKAIVEESFTNPSIDLSI